MGHPVLAVWVPQPSDLHPADVVTSVTRLLKRLTVVAGGDDLSREAQVRYTMFLALLFRGS